MSTVFEITDDEKERVRHWLVTEVYPPIIEKQKSAERIPHAIMASDWEAGFPYQGAIGGGVTYEFTPTSVGIIVKARAYDQTLDLTDYDSW